MAVGMAEADTVGRSWRQEARRLIALALPLVAGNLAWSGIAAIDLLLLGRLGPDAVAAGALAMNLYIGFLVAGMGLTAAASPLIASERGRRRHAVRDIRRTVRQAMWSAVVLCLPCWLILWNSDTILPALGQDAELARGAAELLRGLQWAMLPYLGFLTLRNFIAALERPFWGFAVLALGLPANLLFGWMLIFGHLGMPALGLFGAGLASSCSSVTMLLALTAVVLTDRRFRRYRLLGRWWVADWGRFRDIWRIGVPIGVTQALEVTVFSAAVFFMGLIGRTSIAAHAIAIQIAALSFMIPMGIGQAATVRVGYAQGAGDAQAVGRAGWVALAIGCAWAAIAALILVIWPRPFIGVFIDLADPANAEVVRMTIAFLGVAALFQLVDAAQAVAAGALRGLQDTRVPMICAAIGYWVVGLGTSLGLAFPLKMNGVGIWLGLATGLGFVAVALVWRWARRERLGLMRPA